MVPLLTYHRINATAENEKNQWSENIPGKIAEIFTRKAIIEKTAISGRDSSLNGNFIRANIHFALLSLVL